MDPTLPELPFVHISDFEPISSDILAIFPPGLVRKKMVVPVQKKDGRVMALVPKSNGIVKPEGLQLMAGCPVDLAMAPAEEIIKFIETHYGNESKNPESETSVLYPPENAAPATNENDQSERPDEDALAIVDEFEGAPTVESPDPRVEVDEANFIEFENSRKRNQDGKKGTENTSSDEIANEVDPTSVGQRPIPELWQQILKEAIKNGANEILVEEVRGNYRFRQRIRGALVSWGPWQNWDADTVKGAFDSAQRLGEKFEEAGFKWFENTRPFEFEGKSYTVFMKLSETYEVKILTVRITLASVRAYAPSGWGMEKKQEQTLNRLLDLDHGLILFCGSEKGVMNEIVRSCAHHMATPERHVIAVENHFHEKIPGVDQLSAKGSPTIFRDLLRTASGHSPDCLLINPLERKPDFEFAFSEAIKGNLVIARQFSWDAGDAIGQLFQMGLDPYLIKHGLAGLVSSIKLRLNCSHCQKKQYVRREETRDLGIPVEMAPPSFFEGEGCEKCHQSGFGGQLDIFEVFAFSEDVRNALHPKMSPEKIRTLFQVEGMETMRQVALRKAVDGQTSLNEVIRVTLK